MISSSERGWPDGSKEIKGLVRSNLSKERRGGVTLRIERLEKELRHLVAWRIDYMMNHSDPRQPSYLNRRGIIVFVCFF